MSLTPRDIEAIYELGDILSAALTSCKTACEYKEKTSEIMRNLERIGTEYIQHSESCPICIEAAIALKKIIEESNDDMAKPS